MKDSIKIVKEGKRSFFFYTAARNFSYLPLSVFNIFPLLNFSLIMEGGIFCLTLCISMIYQYLHLYLYTITTNKPTQQTIKF